jgi:cation transport ATPase
VHYRRKRPRRYTNRGDTFLSQNRHPESQALPVTLRKLLLLTLVVSLVGTLAELLLLEHFEDAWQWAPIVLLAAALVTLGWHALERGPTSLNILRALMVVCIVSGAIGLWLHYSGNVEFELEMYPDLSGWKLFKDAMMGATPALAPGAMVQIGLVGLAWTFRHPAFKPESQIQSLEG